MSTNNRQILYAARMASAIRRMAIEVVGMTREFDDLMIVGIRSRGVNIGQRIVDEIQDMEGRTIPFGALDITLYRDDLATVGPQRVAKPTVLPGRIDGKVVVLVDDVLYTGRTIRAALEALIEHGRPERVMVAVLAERIPVTEHGERTFRDMPICASIVGKSISTFPNQRIQVHCWNTTDGVDGVLLVTSS